MKPGLPRSAYLSSIGANASAVVGSSTANRILKTHVLVGEGSRVTLLNRDPWEVSPVRMEGCAVWECEAAGGGGAHDVRMSEPPSRMDQACISFHAPCRPTAPGPLPPSPPAPPTSSPCRAPS